MPPIHVLFFVMTVAVPGGLAPSTFATTNGDLVWAQERNVGMRLFTPENSGGKDPRQACIEFVQLFQKRMAEADKTGVIFASGCMQVPPHKPPDSPA